MTSPGSSLLIITLVLCFFFVVLFYFVGPAFTCVSNYFLFSLDNVAICYFFRAILSQFTEEQMSRYESFRRAGFQKANMKRVCFVVPPTQNMESFLYSAKIVDWENRGSKNWTPNKLALEALILCQGLFLTQKVVLFRRFMVHFINISEHIFHTKALWAWRADTSTDFPLDFLNFLTIERLTNDWVILL